VFWLPKPENKNDKFYIKLVALNLLKGPQIRKIPSPKATKKFGKLKF